LAVILGGGINAFLYVLCNYRRKLILFFFTSYIFCW